MSASRSRPASPGSATRLGGAFLALGLVAPAGFLLASPASAAPRVALTALEFACGVQLSVSGLPAGPHAIDVTISALSSLRPLDVVDAGQLTLTGGAPSAVEVLATPLEAAAADQEYVAVVTVDEVAQQPVQLALPGCATGPVTQEPAEATVGSPAQTPGPSPTTHAGAGAAPQPATESAEASAAGSAEPSVTASAEPSATATAEPSATAASGGAASPATAASPSLSPSMGPALKDDDDTVVNRTLSAGVAPAPAPLAAAGPATVATRPYPRRGGTGASGMVALTFAGVASAPLTDMSAAALTTVAPPPLLAPAGAIAPEAAAAHEAPQVALPAGATGPVLAGLMPTSRLAGLLPLADLLPATASVPDGTAPDGAPAPRALAAAPASLAGERSDLVELMPPAVLTLGVLVSFAVVRLRRVEH